MSDSAMFFSVWAATVVLHLAATSVFFGVIKQMNVYQVMGWDDDDWFVLLWMGLIAPPVVWLVVATRYIGIRIGTRMEIRAELQAKAQAELEEIMKELE